MTAELEIAWTVRFCWTEEDKNNVCKNASHLVWDPIFHLETGEEGDM